MNLTAIERDGYTVLHLAPGTERNEQEVERIVALLNANMGDNLLGELSKERCPKCGANLLKNKVGDKWCSLVGCDYSINAPEKVGTDEWRHKYFGAEWPEKEGRT